MSHGARSARRARSVPRPTTRYSWRAKGSGFPLARGSRALARQLALGVGIRSVVSGSLRSFSGGYAVSLHLISAASGQVLATAEAPVTNLRDPFAAWTR
jgi:hypothetical protein